MILNILLAILAIYLYCNVNRYKKRDKKREIKMGRMLADEATISTKQQQKNDTLLSVIREMRLSVRKIRNRASKECPYTCPILADLSELVDDADSKSAACERVGSNPTISTKK